MNRALIQYQDRSGFWTTVAECESSDTNIWLNLNAYQLSYGRVRAIDANTKSIIDIRG